MSITAKTSRIRYEVMERSYHESLHNNICLLSQRHPPSEHLKKILSNDMFKKSNKTAFFHLIHYLFNILDPERTKAQLDIPYDLESEQKFRSEVMNYLSVLRDLCKGCDIPNITNSHLVTPGGFKFARFMFSVSQLVLKEDLRKMGVLTLNCPRKECSKDHKENCRKSIYVMSNSIVDETEKIANEFGTYLDESEKNVKEMGSLISKLDSELNQKLIASEQLKVEFKEKYPSCPSLHSLQERFLLMKQERERLSFVCETLSTCEDLLELIAGPATTMEYKNDQNSDRLNLIEFFNSSTQLIKRKALNLPRYSSCFLEKNKKVLEDLTAEHLVFYDELQQNENFQELSEQVLNNLKDLLYKFQA